MLAFHREKRASVTIALTHVDDARPFGLVPTDDEGRVSEFLEKPTDLVAGDVNAGTYVLDPAVLHGFARGEPSSIERDIFPAIIADGRPVYGFVSHGYWMDLGTPEKYLQAHADILEGKVEGLRYAAPWIAASARIDPAAVLGRDVVVGEDAAVGAGAALDRAVIHPGAEVGDGADVRDSIVGPGARVGRGASVLRSVLGEGSAVAPGARLEDARVRSRSAGT
jgi:mannose-1-phosphate guanylyltransferase